MKTRNEIILEGLESRLESIRDCSATLKEVDHKNRDYSSLYEEISYFLHFILNTEEFKGTFNELYFYIQRLPQNGKYTTILNDIEKGFKEISKQAISHPNFGDYKDKQSGKFKNPFTQRPLLTASEFLNQVGSLKIIPKGPLVSFLTDINIILAEIWNKLFEYDEGDWKEIIRMFGEVKSKIRTIEYFEEFEHNYLGAQSAKNLISVYLSLNPQTDLETNTNLLLIAHNVQEGKGIYQSNTLSVLNSDCKNLFYYLKRSLTITLSIESVIDRFTNYISLYFKGSLSGSKIEKQLQEKFEEFIFQSGFYPISEAQIGNGRLDTLILDYSNSFLTELKQVNLSRTKDKQKKINKILSQARIQSSVYFDRLKSLPKLSNVVFIIVFTDQNIFFQNNLDRLRKDGILFIFKKVGLYEKSPSKLPEAYPVNIEDLIE